jgi:2'-5' RNA ligase
MIPSPEKANALRLFIAISLPDHIKYVLREQVKQWEHVWSFQKWVHPDDYHLTLKFLGPTSRSQVPLLEQRLLNVVTDITPFTLSLGQAGIFGEQYRPRILWMGVGGEMDHLKRLQQAVETQMVPLGYPAEHRPFRPHLTLARKYIGHDRFCLDQINHLKSPEMGLSWKVNALTLYQSQLGREPMYRALKRFQFNG